MFISREVDHRGIDFVLKLNGTTYADIQVKSVRSLNYIFFTKDKFTLRPNLFVNCCPTGIPTTRFIY